MTEQEMNQKYSEARIFARHSDGKSLIVPKFDDTHIRRLSFSVQTPVVPDAPAMFDVVQKLLQTDEEHGLNDFYLQRYLGRKSYMLLGNTSRNMDAFGYMAQITIGKSVHHEIGRQILPFSEAERVVNAEANLDRLDRDFAGHVLKITMR
jgi:hypothetical protein